MPPRATRAAAAAKAAPKATRGRQSTGDAAADEAAAAPKATRGRRAAAKPADAAPASRSPSPVKRKAAAAKGKAEPEAEAAKPKRGAGPARERRSAAAADPEPAAEPELEPEPAAEPEPEPEPAAKPARAKALPAAKRGRGKKAASPKPEAEPAPQEPAPKRARAKKAAAAMPEPVAPEPEAPAPEPAAPPPRPPPPARAPQPPTGRGGRGPPFAGGRGPPPGRGGGRGGRGPRRADADGADSSSYRPSGGALTAADVEADPITALAAERWPADAAARAAAPPYDPSLVARLWADVLGGGGRPPSRRRVAVLELSRFLELYLVPHFPPPPAAPSRPHLLATMALLVEKDAEGVPAWGGFDGEGGAGSLAALFAAATALVAGADAPLADRTLLLRFSGLAFQSLEHAGVRSHALRLVGLPLWRALAPGRAALELAAAPALAKHWKRLAKKDKAAAAAGADPRAGPESSFVPALVDAWLAALAAAPPAPDPPLALYLETGAGLWGDMLAQLPTRRFTRAVLDERGVLLKASRSAPVALAPRSRLARLVALARHYADFPIDDHTGEAAPDADRARSALARGAALQRLLFRHHPAARDLALAPAMDVCTPGKLAAGLGGLSDADLRALVVDQARVVRPDDPESHDRDFLLAALGASYALKPGTVAAAAATPLYPTEAALLDPDAVPTDARGRRAGPLPLPKLNLQFLTAGDYLLRNLELYRLEAAAEIRDEVVDALARLAPAPDPANPSNLTFRGWARMAARVGRFAVTEVKRPRVGDDYPASVSAELDLSLAGMRPDVRAEWDGLRQHDVLFLLAVGPPRDPAALGPDPSPAALAGLTAMRGAEIVEVRDSEGGLMNDFTGRVRREDAKAPAGDGRTFVLALDPAQYQADMEALARGGMHGDVYSTFSVALRRRGKENNFKAVLSAARGALADGAPLPDWLRDAFLGYGDPVAATWRGLPRVGAWVDVRDTLVDEAHVGEAFPDYEIRWDAPASSSRAPPYRVALPDSEYGDGAGGGGEPGPRVLTVAPYTLPPPPPFAPPLPPPNAVRFTPAQTAAIVAGLQPGLTQVVGPPGTGKTDVAVQILTSLYHANPNGRTLLVTHSNQALNDLFAKLVARDVPARHLVRLGAGEADLAAADDFSRAGRVNALLARRLELLADAERLGVVVGAPPGAACTCEAAASLDALRVRPAWAKFKAALAAAAPGDAGAVAAAFPFAPFFEPPGAGAPPLFTGADRAANEEAADGAWRALRALFAELEELRPLEILKSASARTHYLVTRLARVVAMTCTHAAIKRGEFVGMGFK